MTNDKLEDTFKKWKKKIKSSKRGLKKPKKAWDLETSEEELKNLKINLMIYFKKIWNNNNNYIIYSNLLLFF